MFRFGNLGLSGGGGGGGSEVLGATAALEGYDDGFAYVGTRNGVVAAVKDTGTPANDLDDVPIDNVVTNTAGDLRYCQDATGRYRPVAHNLHGYSEVQAGWGEISCTITPNADGNLAQWTEAGGTASRYSIGGVTAATQAGAVYWGRAKIKAGTKRYMEIAMFTQTYVVWVIIDTTTMTITNSGAAGGSTLVSSEIELVGSNYYVKLVGICGGVGFPYLWVLGAAASGSGHLTNYASAGETFFFSEVQTGRGDTFTDYVITPGAGPKFLVPQAFVSASGVWEIAPEPLEKSNKLIHSNDGTKSVWTGGGVGKTMVANQGEDCFGKMKATLLKEDSSDGYHTLYAVWPNTVVEDQRYGFSVFMEPSGRSKFLLNISNLSSSVHPQVYDVIDLAAMTSTNPGWKITNVFGELYRLEYEGTGLSDGSLLLSLVMYGGNDAKEYQGDNVSGILIHGIQLEDDFVSSPKPNGATVLDYAGDALEVDLSDIPFNATVGSVYQKYTPSHAGPEVENLWQLFYDANNQTGAYIAADGHLYASNTSASTENVAMDMGLVIPGTPAQLSYSYAVNDFAASRDGGDPVTDSSGALPSSAPDTLLLGGGAFSGTSEKFSYVPEAV